ncbi:hypothetical protein OHT57_14610 [Streptomyces sp. NBC_00285]|uniref:hypothetical protein n=1 Tax=Streptomyces sp. NBC_00285 TaxID=2975700 RepID=UPI002E2AF66D|nr:hypothetical protein [Streptomyces sp. NBC_00285]
MSRRPFTSESVWEPELRALLDEGVKPDTDDHRLLVNPNGRFGRELPRFSWERTDRVDASRKAAGL